MSSKWDEHGFDDKVRQILTSVSPSSPDHHLGLPFLTAYQLALEFDRRHHDIVVQLGYQVGGKAIGEHVSLAQYIAKQLSQRIKAGKLPDMEGGFLSRQDIVEFSFSGGIRSSADGAWDPSIFRMKAKP